MGSSAGLGQVGRRRPLRAQTGAGPAAEHCRDRPLFAQAAELHRFPSAGDPSPQGGEGHK